MIKIHMDAELVFQDKEKKEKMEEMLDENNGLTMSVDDMTAQMKEDFIGILSESMYNKSLKIVLTKD